ncbi:MAG: basic secretory protein-like protein [Pirellula sp.]|jgi:hypothetical protein
MPHLALKNLGICASLLYALSAAMPASNPVAFHSAAIDVVVEWNLDSDDFRFPTIPLPAVDDDGVKATWAVARGLIDDNSPGLSVLYDGSMPPTNDSPDANFFFAGSASARSISVDLGESIELDEVTTYSWHSGGRAPQVYSLYGAVKLKDGQLWNRLDDETNPPEVGWIKIADVDTRERQARGGQHASRIAQADMGIGTFRYLLFDIQTVDPKDPFGDTFFSEIDIVAKSHAIVKRIEAPELVLVEFSSDDGRYQYVVDVTAAPAMLSWTKTDLKPVIQEWYPKIVELLPSDNFLAPNKVVFRYQPNSKMNGIPAYTQLATITLNSEWMHRERNREAKGAVVHEMVHVVQSYQSIRERRVRRRSTPGWIVEGIPDYIRWYLYEPQSQGAMLSKAVRSQSKHDASYRVSANFIDWVIRSHDRDGSLLRNLNSVARIGEYTSDIWQKLTGKTEAELADLWREG